MVIGRCLIILGLFVIFMAMYIPLFLSYMGGGWIRKYTSANPFFVKDIPFLSGQVAIVTGANTGIGLETARELARKGAEVIVAARSKQKGEAAVGRIVASVKADLALQGLGDPKVQFMKLDLGSLPSVRSFAEAFKKTGLPLHMLVLNAGVMKSPGEALMGRKFYYGYETTAQGFEMHIGVNHIAHFYLTELLGPILKQSSPARVVAVSSAAEAAAYESGMRFDMWRMRGLEYEDGMAYGQSKLANILFARELAERWNGTGVTAYSCHPGIIATELARHMAPEMEKDLDRQGAMGTVFGTLFKMIYENAVFTPEDGALTQLHLTVAPEAGLSNGAYYEPIGTEAQAKHAQASNATLQKILWDRTKDAIARALK